MGKVRHHGKNRQDKYYKLAKEQGYRARSAFKLIQLNKKFDLLSSARVAIDLCAAPGGWMQVCARFMPVGSTIIGLDLDPIKPVRGCKSFVEDITTPKCRQTLRSELKDKRADLVLHDGAPNVGQAWAKDAYGQSELTLHALKLATEFLRPGGAFVTKVFRSADYTSLMWVFQQLFRHVHVTKPLSSRNSSAEIFVVCKGFLAPDKIDPRMLDPRHVFAMVDESSAPAVDVLHAKAKQKRHREGYDAATGQLLYRASTVSEFLTRADPLRVLTDCNEIRWDAASEPLKRHPATSSEVVMCLQDLRVLSKSDFKDLLKWRSAVMAEWKRLREEQEREKQAEAVA
eukprot:CAMPEP_0196775398 /NCGR_PEP_ID=MMETSP1104-20130614/4000_1 /TAXON_ID=33652 /ORGANISM="Cafeteria sp., Strain Caron Lab Isolate" /LENGTH=342 /DNA_ID=CAMNT_0042145563 /DNA_START=20 /DNA_END=1045 /DNA_ORIENTATION=-